jgi:hypothetical protein
LAADDKNPRKYRGRKAIGEQTMRNGRDIWRIAGMILLAIFVFAVVLPLALKVVGITLLAIIGLAVLLIKVAVTLAVAYLVLVGIRALLR